MAKIKKPIFEKDLSDKQCVWKTDGYQCQDRGHLSTMTLGAGPWYCRQHFAKLNSWASWEAAVSNDSQADIDARVNRIVPRNDGESEHAWSMRCKAPMKLHRNNVSW